MTKNKLNKLKNFLVNSGFEGTQTFSTRNIVGDTLTTVYADDNVSVDYCEDYDYLEIFGLSEYEYMSLSDILDIC